MWYPAAVVWDMEKLFGGGSKRRIRREEGVDEDMGTLGDEANILRIDELKAELDALRAKNSKLEAENAALRAKTSNL